MRSTFKILFYLKKNTPKPDGTVPVMGRITIDGTISQFSLKMNVPVNLWDTKAGKLSGKSILVASVLGCSLHCGGFIRIMIYCIFIFS